MSAPTCDCLRCRIMAAICAYEEAHGHVCVRQLMDAIAAIVATAVLAMPPEDRQHCMATTIDLLTDRLAERCGSGAAVRH